MARNFYLIQAVDYERLFILPAKGRERTRKKKLNARTPGGKGAKEKQSG